MVSRSARRVVVSAAVGLALAALGGDAAAAAPARSDLTVTGVSAHWQDSGGTVHYLVAPGAIITAAERTMNAGGAFAPQSTTRWFLRSSNGRNFLLAGQSVSALAPGQSAAARKEVVIPKVPAGQYAVMACADARRGIVERRERNNCRTAPNKLVVRADAAPVVTPSAGSTSVDEGAAALVDSALTVSDVDDATLTAAYFQLVGDIHQPFVGDIHQPFVGDIHQPLFAFASQLGITGTYNSGTGVLTLQGTAPVVAYQSALRSVWFGVTGDAPPAGVVAEVRVRDGLALWSAPARRGITINPVNDAPRLGSGPTASSYVPGSGPKAIAADLALLDPDSLLAGATIAIELGFESGDELVFASQLGITGTYNSGTGVLTLTGAGSLADYQTALRSVAFSRATTPVNKTRRFTFQVTDAQGAASNYMITDAERMEAR